MKRFLLSICIIFIVSCKGDVVTYETKFKKGKTEYKLKKVWVDDGEVIYILYPINDSLLQLPSQITHHQGDATTTTIILE